MRRKKLDRPRGRNRHDPTEAELVREGQWTLEQRLAMDRKYCEAVRAVHQEQEKEDDCQGDNLDIAGVCKD